MMTTLTRKMHILVTILLPVQPFIAGMVYWVARQDFSLDDLSRANERITSLENRTTILETGIGQLQMKIDGIKEDVTLIKSAVIK